MEHRLKRQISTNTYEILYKYQTVQNKHHTVWFNCTNPYMYVCMYVVQINVVWHILQCLHFDMLTIS